VCRNLPCYNKKEKIDKESSINIYSMWFRQVRLTEEVHWKGRLLVRELAVVGGRESSRKSERRDIYWMEA